MTINDLMGKGAEEIEKKKFQGSSPGKKYLKGHFPRGHGTMGGIITMAFYIDSRTITIFMNTLFYDLLEKIKQMITGNNVCTK